MARLNFLVQWINANSSASRSITLSVTAATANYTGAPKARIYKDGDTPPSFTNMTLGTTNFTQQKLNLDDSIYVVEYQDNDGSRTLGKFKTTVVASTCFAGNSLFAFAVLDSKVRVLSTLTEPFSASIDNGTTFKSYPIGSPNGAEWTNSELDAMGLSNSIPILKTKRTSNDCVDSIATLLFVQTETLDPLEGSLSKTDVTTSGGSDGTITTTVIGGSGNYSYSWADGPTTQNRSGLSAGSYTITITDLVTSEEIELSTSITEPQVIPPQPDGSILQVPMLNSISFVIPETIDGCTVFQTLDNTLFKDQYFPGYGRANYFQPFAKCDAPVIQFNSDFPVNTVSLYKCENNELIKNITVELKEENIGVVEDFTISIRNHTGFVGKSRVYFSASTGAIPIPLSPGESFEVLNNSDDFNGIYTIVDILTDSITGQQYLIINLTYDAGSPISPGTGRFDVSNEDFNVYEAACDFLDVDNGVYFIKISSYDTDPDDGKYAISEPLDIQVEHLKTNLLEYYNSDNAFDITWTTGYQGRIRVPSVLFRRLPGGEVDTSRDADYSLVTTSGKVTRGVLLQTFLLPPYMHEKLSVIFKLDFKFINKVQYNTLEGYAEPQYQEQVMLSNSSIKLEQVGWFTKYNSNDIGTVNEGGFILSDQGFIKR